mgnify:CR=1 FL=1
MGGNVKPTTYGNQNGLLYNRWVKQRQEMVEKLSNGKIGYVHVKSMDSPSFRKVILKYWANTGTKKR